MASCFRIEMLPARQGDCLWVEYGAADHPHRLLIDGGTTATHEVIWQRLGRLPARERQFELLIVTHIDGDHIGGLLKLLDEAAKPAHSPGQVCFDDIWFNGWRHLPGSDFEEFGPVQGERLTSQLLAAGRPWNLHFGARAVRVPDDAALPVCTLPGGMKLTLLSPRNVELAALRPVWEKECTAAHLNPASEPPPPKAIPPGLEGMGVFDVDKAAESVSAADGSQANGSSIAVLAEFGGRRALLAGDAHADVLLAGLARLAGPGAADRLPVDVFKLPHHGSKSNVSKALLEKVVCRRYLFSTDGTQFEHPDKEAVARVVRFGGPQPQLIFNYRTEFNAFWENPAWIQRYGYGLVFPEAGVAGMVVEL